MPKAHVRAARKERRELEATLTQESRDFAEFKKTKDNPEPNQTSVEPATAVPSPPPVPQASPPAPAEASPLPKKEAVTAFEKEVYIDASSKFTHLVPVIPGTIVCWKFRTKDYDVGFGYQWCDPSGAPSAGQADVQMHRHESQLKEVSGEIVSQQAGHLVLIWDNSFSWVNGKSLHLYVTTSMSDEFEASCMMQAVAEAKKSAADPLGCVILQRSSGKPISTGSFNEELFLGPMWNDVMVALEKCNRLQTKPDFSDTVLYTTAEPDMMSWGAIGLYGICLLYTSPSPRDS
eukprot:TRINITY_DN1197_c0_g1_i6.p1 TRINITY_DN1197_c0_g1~~TRINITY_DN1197_c0_g1_i6.p1  ORF type:complete len:290 (-),score=68.74 TRINITY_DN1197_c0_g1_i6:99-968(-)